MNSTSNTLIVNGEVSNQQNVCKLISSRTVDQLIVMLDGSVSDLSVFN